MAKLRLLSTPASKALFLAAITHEYGLTASVSVRRMFLFTTDAVLGFYLYAKIENNL